MNFNDMLLGKGFDPNTVIALRARKPDGFKTSILERVSPDMDAGDVIRLESNWKDRLHTRAPHGLNEN